MGAGGRIRRILGSEIAALCLVVFLADVVGGIISPTFSLYAKSLGLSLALIGLLSTVGGFTQLLTSLRNPLRPHRPAETIAGCSLPRRPRCCLR